MNARATRPQPHHNQMTPRRTQIIAILATILIVGGFVGVPHKIFAGSPATEVYATEATAQETSQEVNASVTGATSSESATTAYNNAKNGNDNKCSLTSWTVTGCINSALTYIINNILLSVANWFLTLTGIILNAVMVLTINMSAFVSASGGVVDTTWSTIRDISSILIIFFLLYTSIKIIIGITDSKVQHIIVMVAIAGILINFSLFFTKMAIDASNLVGMAFYRAIAPSGATIDFNQSGSGSNYLSNAFGGGISNEFMSALKIQKMAYDSTTFSTSSVVQTKNTNPLAIIIAGLSGAIIMVVAGLSFLAASLLFTIRIGLLIILMAFSPVYFVGMIVPDIKEKLSDRWRNMLVNQCLILPVYMLFMYVALRVITNSSFQKALNPSNTSAGTALFSVSVVGTFMTYIIGLILICLPLIAALEYASVGKDWVNAGIKNAKKWGQGAVSGTLRKSWQETGGRAMSKVANTEKFRNFAANYKVGEWALKGTRGVAQSYNAKLDKQVKSRTEFAESLGVNQKSMNQSQAYLRQLRANLARAQVTPGTPPANIASLKTAVGNAETAIVDLENRRKSDYANRINSKIIDAPFIKVGRKNKKAAAQLLLDVENKKLEGANSKLNATRDKIKSIKSNLDSLTQKLSSGSLPNPIQAQNTINQLKTDLQTEQNKETNDLAAVNAIQANIYKYKLTS